MRGKARLAPHCRPLLHDHGLVVRINSANDASISCENFVKFGPVTPTPFADGNKVWHDKVDRRQMSYWLVHEVSTMRGEKRIKYCEFAQYLELCCTHVFIAVSVNFGTREELCKYLPNFIWMGLLCRLRKPTKFTAIPIYHYLVTLSLFCNATWRRRNYVVRDRTIQTFSYPVVSKNISEFQQPWPLSFHGNLPLIS